VGLASPKSVGQTSRLEILDANRLSPGQKSEGKPKRRIHDPDFFTGEVTPEQKMEVERRLSYTYPYEAARRLKSKYSVSELNKLACAVDDAGSGHPKNKAVETAAMQLAVPKFRQGERTLTAAEKGTIYHGIMERIDFGRVAAEGLPYVEMSAADMIEKAIFTEKEIRAVALTRIAGFFESDLGRRAALAFVEGRLERERPFALQMELEGEQIITQGIIDCYFEEEDGFVLLDYKTNWIDQSKPFEEEAARLRAAYAKQMDIYQTALHAATGRPIKEVYLYLFGAGVAVKI